MPRDREARFGFECNARLPAALCNRNLEAMKTASIVLVALSLAACSDQSESDAPAGTRTQAGNTVTATDSPTASSDAALTREARPPLREVPIRFRGHFAPDRKACAKDYTYAPTFENVEVFADRVSFFETGGPVTNVQVDGDAAAITLRETIGDNEVVRAIYLALDGDGTARYRPGRNEDVRDMVICQPR